MRNQCDSPSHSFHLAYPLGEKFYCAILFHHSITHDDRRIISTYENSWTFWNPHITKSSPCRTHEIIEVFLFFYFSDFYGTGGSHITCVWLLSDRMNIYNRYEHKKLRFWIIFFDNGSMSSSSSCILNIFFSALLFTPSTWQEVSKTITWNIYTACAFLELWRWRVNQNQHFLSLTSFLALQLCLCLSLTSGWETWKFMYFIIRNAIRTHKKTIHALISMFRYS